MKTKICLLSCTIFISILTFAQSKNTAKETNYLKLSWVEVATKMPDSWYGTSEAKKVAENVIRYQCEIGGWPKNTGFHKPVNEEEMARIKSSGIGATFDNRATTTEMIFLAKVYAQQKDEKYKNAFVKALDYIFKAQYPNGGWPQFYPYRIGKSVNYASHITYNDNAMVNVMTLLKDVSDGNTLFAPMAISENMKQKAKSSFDKGVECILNTQIVVDGKPTVWCAQHDEFTLAPAKARSYELASFSGAESASITILLMGIDNPSAKVKYAIESAVQWFHAHKIEGVRIDRGIDKDGKVHRTLVDDAKAPLIWARFYDLETGKPFFCDRDGVKKNSLSEIGDERRNGYDWYTTAPGKLDKLLK